MAISSGDARQILRDHYGLDAGISRLESEWGGTFKCSAPDGQTYVLKVSPPDIARARLELEIACADHLQQSSASSLVPSIVQAADGASSVFTHHGAARLYSWMDGRLWAEVIPVMPELQRQLGQSLARLKQGLKSFQHPAADGAFPWSPHNPQVLARPYTGPDAELVRFAHDSQALVLERVKELPHSLNYNDCNENNIIVSHDRLNPEIVGFIDFGDLDRGPRINDLAICIAYAAMGFDDPIGAACQIIGGYHSVERIFEKELEVLLQLMVARLGISLVMANERAKVDPENQYWQTSTQGVRVLLSKLKGYNNHLALCRFRHACGYEPCPKAIAVKRWLRDHISDIHPVMGFELNARNTEVFDWSVGSSELGGFDEIADVETSTWQTFRRIADAGVIAGIGRYNEPRGVYTAEGFRSPGNFGPEMRTIHIGLDVFMPAGTPVYAPLDGVVHTIVNNDRPKEYGPLLILKHTVEGLDHDLYTLYGHNSLATLSLWSKGDRVKAGEKIAEIGNYPENGNWVPHLHFQVMTDTLGYVGDFPGVALNSQRDVWLSISPDPNLFLGIEDPGLRTNADQVEALAERRQRLLGSNLSLSYGRPLHIVRGWMNSLYDANGVAYLDTRNNIAHVGHEHPAVREAAARQIAVLNTNTRYLHHLRTALAERLLNTLPETLSRIYFVNSGSEANDLALRIAYNYTGTRKTIVMDQAYHGHTDLCIDVSPYKFDGPGGGGGPGHVEILPPLADIDDGSTVRAARLVRDVMGNDPAVFIHEAMPSCAGQVIPPDDYFKAVYQAIRTKGGICIADEVQTGLGRTGEHFWAFGHYRVEPDIVTMGKPLGNGHPVAAVAVSEELAMAFDNGMEYFNSFGGNPVACAVGLEVLNVIEREKLMARAVESGNLFLQELRRLAEKYPIIKDVRGRGLFIGIEFDQPKNCQNEILVDKYISERLLRYRILSSFDGPGKTVMKIKPPLQFSGEDIRYVIDCLDTVLSDDYLRH